MPKQRIAWVDTAKYICIIFVMLAHLESNTYLLSVLYKPFYLSVFFFVSGYVYIAKDNFGEFLYKKFCGLFVPWLVFSVFNILLSQIISFNNHGNLQSELCRNFLQIRGRGDGVWFVAALFMAFIPFYFVVRWSDKCKRSTVVIFFSFLLSVISVTYTILMEPTYFPWGTSALPWHVEYIFQAMFFMVLGYFFKVEFEKNFDKYNTTRNRIVCVGMYLLLVYIPYFAQFQFSSVTSIVYQYLCQLFGIVCVISICKKVKSNRYVLYIGSNTLICFALHGKIYSLVQTIFKRFVAEFYNGILLNTVASSIFAIVFALGLSVILIVPIYVINRWFPFVLGRRKEILQ